MRVLLLVLSIAVLGCPRELREPVTTNPNAPGAAPAPEAQIATPRSLAPGEACTTDGQCPEGHVCEGCGEEDKVCVPGCRSDEDCSDGEQCQTVQCLRCPCPKLCGAP